MKKKEAGNAKRSSTVSPETGSGESVITRASQRKTRNKALARQLRKTGQIASLSAEVSSVVEDFAGMSNRIARSLAKGKKSLDKVTSETQDANRFSEILSENSGLICETVSKTYAAIEFMTGNVGENTRLLDDMLDTVNRSAKVHSEIKRIVEELEKTDDKSGKLVNGINHIAELIDVAGLNASLEAGRSGENCAGFFVLAERIQKTSAVFEKAAGDFCGLVSDMNAGSHDTAEKVTEIGDRIRAVSVMTKGVKNACNEIRTDFTELCEWAEAMFVRAHEVFSDRNDYPPGSEAIVESAHNAASLSDKAGTALERGESTFAVAAEQSNLLSSVTERLAAEQDLPSALDDIITIAEDIMDVAEETEEELESAVHILDDTAQVMEDLERKAEFTGGKLEEMAGCAAEILDTSGSVNEKLEKVLKNITESQSALKGLAGEIEMLIDEIRAFDRKIHTFGLHLQRIDRFITSLSSLSTKLDCISMYGELEIAHSGLDDSGFSAVPERLESIAAEITETIKSLSGYSDAFEQKVTELISYMDDTDWQAASEMVKAMLGETIEAIDHDIPSVLENTASIISSGQRQVKDIDRSRDRIKEAVSSSESAANMVRDACETAGKQRDTLKRAFEAGEKLQVRAEELYPEEE